MVSIFRLHKKITTDADYENALSKTDALNRTLFNMCDALLVRVESEPHSDDGNEGTFDDYSLFLVANTNTTPAEVGSSGKPTWRF